MARRLSFSKMIGYQLQRPSGIVGRLVGQSMALINREPNRIAIDALNVLPTDTVLELGFGPGRAIRALSSKVCHGRVVGIDHSREMLDQASFHNACGIRQGRVQLRRGRFDRLPWDENTIDKILAVNVVYFFQEDAAEIREARRVLRPGGLMAIYATDKSAMSRWKIASPDTHRIFDRTDLVSLIRRGGFDCSEISATSITLAFRVPGILAVLRKGSA